MIHVDLIVLGKLKESYLRDACAEYEKRLQAFCRLRTVELTPYRLPDDPNETQIRDALDQGCFADFKKKMLDQLEGDGD